jgi:hypothetical protein
VKRVARQAIQILPRAVSEPIFRWSHARHIRGLMIRSGVTRVEAEYFRKLPLEVLSGPFAGMRYLRMSTGSTLLPKLLGSYESELHNTLEELIQSCPPVVIDIGCAEGYYAVGLSRRLPTSKVYAFDLETTAQQMAGKLAQLNDVQDRVWFAGECTPDRLSGLVVPGCLIVSDCEGGEWNLLDPVRVPQLLHAQILVEIHADDMVAGAERLAARFENTHQVRWHRVLQRTAISHPNLTNQLTTEDLKIAMCEFRRPDQIWLVLIPYANR